ncbi:MAG: tRNA (adenosine(37)-N6)-threonylcarbamoyltransferase complex ATPase subunit type 1 TsaE [Actinomycetota bacterium]|nr:tRNA (adenosine(37)-N6)-threonylcarbamoyltransferase complex ATPase subunit type 1 TsaE [Actinomycetota bacterium]
MNFVRLCPDDVATRSAGEAFATVVRPGDVVLLTGGLGAGKTTFVKGVARGLGVVERVTSPTFTMVHQHVAHNDRGIATLHHADVYRVESVAEVRDLDLGELVEEAGVVLIEWGELAAAVFGREVLTLSFEFADDEETRVITASGAIDETRARELANWGAS